MFDWHVAGRLTAITDLSLDESSAQDWNQRIHPEDFDSYRQALVRHFKGETNRLKVEYRLRRASGDYIWVADNGQCIRDDNGEAVRLVGAIRDITARKLAETRLIPIHL